MNPLKMLKNKLFGDKAQNSSPVGKIIGVKAKMVKYGIIAGIASFFILIIAVLGVVSYFLGFVQVNVENFASAVGSAVSTVASGVRSTGCILCTEDDLKNLKEKQFQSKINLIGNVLGEKVDKAVLASTILFQGDYYSIIDATYDKNYNEKSFVKKITEFAESLSVTGDDGYTGIEQREIDLIDAATIIMVNSNVDGKYNEESYKKALVSAGYGGGDDFGGWVTNGTSCVTNTLLQTVKGVWNSVPFVSVLFNTGNTVDGLVAVADSVSICNYGFIEGTFDDVHNIKNESTKELKKKKIAQEIIDFANFYKELFPEDEDECSYAGSAGSGEIVNWRQYDERWADIPLGTGGVSVKTWGCTTTAISYILAKSGTQLTVNDFNPGVYAQKGSYSGSLIVWDFSPIAPNMHRLGYYTDIDKSNYVEKISDIINTPYNGKQQFVLVEADDGVGTHWVAVDHVENGVVYVLDPSAKEEGLTDITTMHRWGGSISYEIIYADDVDFGKTGTSSSGKSNGEANSLVTKYLNEMKKIADDDTHGYSMANRNGPDYDCTSFIYYSLKNVGILDDDDPVFSYDEREVLTKNGFTEIPFSIDALQVGDILESDGHTTTIYSIEGDTIKEIAARNNYDGVTGDSSGKEISISTFYNQNYHTIYRLTGADSSCGSSSSNMQKFIDLLGEWEGTRQNCTVRGKPGYETYIDSVDQVYAGHTTGYGITQESNRGLAEAVGYTNFEEDMNNGCADKEYIDKMVSERLSNTYDYVKAKFEEESGGRQLKDYQYYVLVSIYHQWPDGLKNIFIPKFVSTTDYKTYDMFSFFLSHTGVNGAQGGLNRREAEYHLLYNGNFNLDRVYDVVNTESYWKQRVEVYNSETISN